MSEHHSFNLLRDPWIPVLYKDTGTSKRVSVTEAFRDADKIWRIDTGNPLDTLAGTRFLLALLYWCEPDPPDSVDPESLNKPFPETILEKLNQNAPLFELFGDKRRFYQDPGVRNAKNRHPVTNLIHEIPSGRNYPHFVHVTDEDCVLSPAACALGLIRLPVFTTVGGQGKSYGINQTPPVYVLPEAETLAGTLRLSWVALRGRKPGIPAWEDSLQPLEGEIPALTGLTWLPRRVWFHETVFEPSRQCAFLGESVSLGVSETAYEGRAKEDVKKDGYHWRDPHVLSDWNRETTEAKKDAVKLPHLKLTDLSKYPDATARQWLEGITALRKAVQSVPCWRGHADWLIVDFVTDQAKFLDALAFRVRLDNTGDGTEEKEQVIESWQKNRGQVLSGLQRTIIAAQARTDEERKKRTGGLKKSNLAKFLHVQTAYPTETGRMPEWEALLDTAPQALYRNMQRALAPVFFADISVRDIIGQNRLGQIPFIIDRNRYDQPSGKGVKEFTRRLAEQKEGILSLLRGKSGAEIDRDPVAFDLFTGLWWPIRQAHKDAPRRHIAWLACKLYGWVPLEDSTGCHLPDQLARAARRAGSEQARDSIIDRFDLLLNTPQERLEPELQWALAVVRDYLDRPALDWGKLIDHLSVWKRQSLRRYWALRFAETLYPKKEAAGSSETPSIQETAG